MVIPRVIALLAAIFVLITGMQVFAYHGRPPVEWHPAWWHCPRWAGLGIFVEFPAGLLAALFATAFGIKSAYSYRYRS